MRHLVSGRKLNRTWSHRKALLSNLATSLIIQDAKSIRTTMAKAKELRPFIEKIITRAKSAYIDERNGKFPEGHVDVHARREVGKIIRDKKALQFLFDDIAPSVVERNGGYTRIIKLGQRRGDGAEEAIIQLVDWSAKQDGAVSLKDKKRKLQPKKKALKQMVPGTSTDEVSAGEEKLNPVQDVETTDSQVDYNTDETKSSSEELNSNDERAGKSGESGSETKE